MTDLTIERESFWINRERFYGISQALDFALDWLVDLLAEHPAPYQGDDTELAAPRSYYEETPNA